MNRGRINRNNNNNRKRSKFVRKNLKRNKNKQNLNNNIPRAAPIKRNNKNRNYIRRFWGNRKNIVKNNRIENEIRQVNNKLKDMTIKSTNLIVPRKELRTDRLVSPYNMARRGQYIPIYEIKEKVVNMSVYTKINLTINGSAQDIRYTLAFFPYSINFKKELYSFYENPIRSADGNCDHYLNVFFLSDNITAQTYTMTYLETADSGVIGNWKLIGSTMKIYNTSSMINKGGDFSIVKIQTNDIYPLFVNSNVNRALNFPFIRNILNKDYNQAPRNNFSANDTAFIDEYNTSNGTNIFSNPNEYLGCKYATDTGSRMAKFDTDIVGNNVVYLFQTKGVATSQSYVFEIWNVFSVVPCPNSGLGNLGTISNRCFTKQVVDSIKDRPNMYKANK